MKLIDDLSKIEDECTNKKEEEGDFFPECDYKTGSKFELLPVYRKKIKEIMTNIYNLDKQKVIDLKDLKKETNNTNESFIGNIVNFENTIREGWTDKESDITDIKEKIDKLKKLNERYGNIINNIKPQEYYLAANKHQNEILKDKTNNYNNTNKIQKRSAQYDQKEINEMDKILIWFKIVYWIGFIVIIFLLFKFKQWRNIKVYIFLLLIIFLPTLLLKPLINVITKEFFKDNVSVNYILYVCLLVVFIFGLFFFGKLPFVNADKDFYKNSIKKNDILSQK
jgi:cation transport ATPase